jgi:hypothetical protein
MVTNQKKTKVLENLSQPPGFTDLAMAASVVRVLTAMIVTAESQVQDKTEQQNRNGDTQADLPT